MRHKFTKNVTIALGANATSLVGVPVETLRAAILQLDIAPIRLVSASRIFGSPAFPAGSGPDFVNAAAMIETAMPPEALLERLHQIEAAFGRERAERWGPRVLDLDLLTAGDDVLPDRATWQRWARLPRERQAREAPDRLILPHPRMADRAFVLIPLAEIAPDLRHPVTQQTVAEMLRALPEADKAAIQPL